VETVLVGPDGSVTVTLRRHVEPVFARSLPGASGGTWVDATAVAVGIVR
jgi:hypothetical protein